MQSSSGLRVCALFDFDGTLASEKSGWMQDLNAKAGLSLMRDYPFIYPMYQLPDHAAEMAVYSKRFMNYIEAPGREGDLYGRLRQLNSLSIGMTPIEFYRSIALWRAASGIALSHYVFFPMLDLLQRLGDANISTFVVSGSSAHFVRALFSDVQSELLFNKTTPYAFPTLEFVGDSLLVSSNGTFTGYLDNRYVQNGLTERYIVNGKGKAIAIRRYIMKTRGFERPFFAAGNSDGDVEMMQTVAGAGVSRQQPGEAYLLLAVNPVGKRLSALVQELNIQAVNMNSPN